MSAKPKLTTNKMEKRLLAESWSRKAHKWWKLDYHFKKFFKKFKQNF